MSSSAVETVSPVRAWILASRPATLPAAAVPVLVGTSVAMNESAAFRPAVFAATLACALLIQVGTNFVNDYSDFRRGADTEARLGPLRVTQSGLISTSAIRIGIIVAFGLAVLVGAWLCTVGGWPILAIGTLSVLSGIAYTGGPFPLGYHGLGDVFVFLFFGVIAVTGTAYLQTGDWSRDALTQSIPIGLLATNILVVNNLRDRHTDVAAGKHTLAVRIGERATRAQYALFAGAAYTVPIAFALKGEFRPWFLLPLLTVPFALFLARRVLSGTSGRELNPVLEQSGKLLLAFGILTAVGTLLSR